MVLSRKQLQHTAAPMEPCVTLWRVLVHVQQAICAMAGHDYLLRFTSGRIFLQCADCGRESPGWQIDAKIGHAIAHHGTEG
jgi:hypothetical protein